MYRLSRVLVLLILLTSGVHGLAANLPDLNTIQQQARHYYDTQGEWAGTFVIKRFLRYRILEESPTRFIAHLEYEWAYAQDRNRTGTDIRRFIFEQRGGQWQLREMGGNRSGSLE